MRPETNRWDYGPALVEAQRCLGCYQAPCTQACPAGVDVPAFIRRFREGNLSGASAVIYASCPLGSTCGSACPTDTLCEGACTLRELGQAPIRIGALQAYITQACPTPELAAPARASGTKRVAVIGSGPAGIGCAVQLNRLGVGVDVFERQAQPGGWVTSVIPDHRLPQSAVEVDLERLRAAGLPIYFNTEAGQALASGQLDRYDAVFLGIGLSRENGMDLAGGGASGVFSALELLAGARGSQPEDGHPFSGQTVVVIGGGNVALDAAVVARRRGAAQVLVIYRRGKAEMPGWEREYLEACALGVEFRWLSVVDEVLSEGGQVTGVRISRTRYAARQDGARAGVEADPGQPVYTQRCDAVILALGQQLDAGLPAQMALSLRRGLIDCRPGSYQTDVPGVFAAGEAVSGGSTIVACMSAGMAAGREIHAYLSGREAASG